MQIDVLETEIFPFRAGRQTVVKNGDGDIEFRLPIHHWATRHSVVGKSDYI